ncbi:50S ribosomal protein l1 [Phtheirospermum japonicum]|uniref:CL1 n=1 Tax=Phtheirospermum japonicum TaxID=374723 RepID=A0A830AWU0_9LAMI|nr:50S ribosomal protein l1 [Phtheirospermum japonicum]
MAAFKRLLSQTGRRCFLNPIPPPPISLLRHQFSTDPQPSPNPESSSDSSRRPIIIQPVSYPAKPKPPPSEEHQQNSQPENQTSSLDSQDPVNRETRSWSRDEMRYMKDAPPITPVSYPYRVAPLPEDRMKVGEYEKAGRDEGLERERRKIEELRRRGVLSFEKQQEEEDVSLPFPKLIKVDNADQNSKKKGKVIYDLKEAIQLAKASAKKTYDETLEAHVRMTPDLQRTDLKLEGFVRLPHEFGKTYRVAVFADGAAADDARDAGADIVGGSELVENIRTGQHKVDFDVCIATPSMMEHVKKLSRQLKKLMPDSKKGTLTNDISRVVKEAKVPSVRFKKDKTAIVHVGLGKLSFPDEALRENVGCFVNALLIEKPAGLKKSSKFAGYVDSFHICSTMGPSFPISIQSLSLALDRYNRSQLR